MMLFRAGLNFVLVNRNLSYYFHVPKHKDRSKRFLYLIKEDEFSS